MKKALKIAGALLVAFLLLLLLSPMLFRDRIREGVKNLANSTLKSELNFTGMHLSFFSHFPNLSLTLTDVSLKASAPFEQDTLISAREIAFGVNVKSLFGDTIRITRIYFENATVKILYNERGAVNFDVYVTGDTASVARDTASLPGAQLSIEHISFKNCLVTYEDYAVPVRVVARGLNYSGKSSLSGDIFNLTSDVKIDSLDLVYDHKTYIGGKPVMAKLSTMVNTTDLTVVFEKNDLKIKDIPLQFHGKFNFEKDGYQVDLNFLSIMEKEFLSARFRIRQGESLWIFAKANASIGLSRWAKAFDLKSADIRGFYEFNLDAQGSFVTGPVVKGIRRQVDTVILSIPKFNLMTRLTDGYVKYAGLPQPIDQISFSMNVSCPDHDYRNISVELENLRASFLKNRIAGFFRLKGLQDLSVEADLTGSCNLAELKQVIPMDSISLEGLLSVDVKVKGNYAPEKKLFPVTTAEIRLKGGSVKTGFYPHPLEKMEMDAGVTSYNGALSDLVVHVKPLTFEFEGNPFKLEATLENFDNLRYDVKSKGTIDVGKVYKVFSQKGLDLDGYIETDLSLAGTQSDATSGKLDRLRNRGTLKIRGIAMTSEDYPMPFVIREGDIRFDQDRVWFDNFLATYGMSDFRLKGSMKNTINYILGQGGTLTGVFSLNSGLINADEFRAFAGADTAAATEPVQPGVIIIPHDLDVNFKAQVRKALFEGLEVHDLAGEINLEEGIVVLKKTQFNLVGCRVEMDATYGSVTAEKGFFDFHIRADDFDIKRAWNEVEMLREMAPSAGKAEGIVSLDYSLKGMLGADMFPILPSLEGGGVVSIKKVKVYGLKMFNDISKGTQKEGLKNPDLSKVDIHSTISNNTVTLEQFKFKVKGIRVRISGTSTFDSKLNMKVRLGMGPMGIIGIPMKITGTADNPKIRYGRGKDEENLQESDYTDELPQEMLERIKNAKEDDGDEESEPLQQ